LALTGVRVDGHRVQQTGKRGGCGDGARDGKGAEITADQIELILCELEAGAGGHVGAVENDVRPRPFQGGERRVAKQA
jgi:hypothetical protein